MIGDGDLHLRFYAFESCREMNGSRYIMIIISKSCTTQELFVTRCLFCPDWFFTLVRGPPSLNTHASFHRSSNETLNMHLRWKLCANSSMLYRVFILYSYPTHFPIPPNSWIAGTTHDSCILLCTNLMLPFSVLDLVKWFALVLWMNWTQIPYISFLMGSQSFFFYFWISAFTLGIDFLSAVRVWR